MNNLPLIVMGLTIVWALVCFLLSQLPRTIYRPLKADENPSQLKPHEEVVTWRINYGRMWIKRFFIVTGIAWAVTIAIMFSAPVVARGLAPTVTPTASASATMTATARPSATITPTMFVATSRQEINPTLPRATATQRVVYASPAPQQPRVVVQTLIVRTTRIVYQTVIVTTTPGPTQTPWIIYLSPTLPVATETASPTPTETPTQTPTETSTPTETLTP